MVWKFCEIWKSYGNWLSEGQNSVRFYLTVWGMACMHYMCKDLKGYVFFLKIITFVFCNHSSISVEWLPKLD